MAMTKPGLVDNIHDKNEVSIAKAWTNPVLVNNKVPIAAALHGQRLS